MSESSKEPLPLSDTELIALSAAAMSQCIEVWAANQQRIHDGSSMAYDGIGGPYYERLDTELRRRGII
jgi:hypothetical protein